MKNQVEDGNTPSVLKRDGVEKFRGTYNECLMKLHRLQGQSCDWAMKYEGWTIEPEEKHA